MWGIMEIKKVRDFIKYMERVLRIEDYIIFKSVNI